MRTLAPLLVLATACSGQMQVDADHPLQLTVDADGGSTTSDGLQLDVPPGALDQGTTITAYPSVALVDGLTEVSPVWVFGPEGTTFHVPVTVRIALTAEGAAPSVWWTKAGDTSAFEQLATTLDGSWAIASILHFSEGVVADGDCACTDDDGPEAPGDDGADDPSGGADDAATSSAGDPTRGDDDTDAENAGDDHGGACVCDDDGPGDDDGADSDRGDDSGGDDSGTDDTDADGGSGGADDPAAP